MAEEPPPWPGRREREQRHGEPPDLDGEARHGQSTCGLDSARRHPDREDGPVTASLRVQRVRLSDRYDGAIAEEPLQAGAQRARRQSPNVIHHPVRVVTLRCPDHRS